MGAISGAGGLLATFPGGLLYFVKLPGWGRRPIFLEIGGGRWLALKREGGPGSAISLVLQMASKKGKSNFPKWMFEMATPLGRPASYLRRNQSGGGEMFPSLQT